MVLVMGITGSGKSYFVNRLKDGAVLEGDTLESCKSETTFVLLEIRNADASVKAPQIAKSSRLELAKQMWRWLTAQASMTVVSVERRTLRYSVRSVNLPQCNIKSA